MVKVVFVQSRFFGKISKFILQSGDYILGDYAVIFTHDEIVFGRVLEEKFEKDCNVPLDVKNSIFRKACDLDWQKIHELGSLELKYLKKIKQEFNAYSKKIKILYTELSFDMQKIYIYFSSDDKIGFHDAVKKIRSKFNIKSEFRSVNPRNAAKFLGGVGICGRSICCKTFLECPKKINNLSVVNQNIYVGNNKFVGVCGRLMCCLEYEEKMYSKAIQRMPNLGEVVKTSQGLAIVSGINVISETVTATLADDPTSSPLLFKMSDLIY